MIDPVEPRDPKQYLPDGFGTPDTPEDALRAAAALLTEEGRWRQGSFYAHDNNKHPEFDDDPFCNGWGDAPDYTKPYDRKAEDWVRVTKWELPEDHYSPFVEGYADDGEYEKLSPAERVYVDAHRILDHVANERGFESAIVCNDAFNTTRDDVIAMFNDAAACDPSKVLTSVLSS